MNSFRFDIMPDVDCKKTCMGRSDVIVSSSPIPP